MTKGRFVLVTVLAVVFLVGCYVALLVAGNETRKAAARFAVREGRVAPDEYRHLFSEQEYQELKRAWDARHDAK
jgi:hypothetical protein